MLHYLTLPFLWRGLGIAAGVAAGGYIGGAILGVGIAALTSSRMRWATALGRAYVGFFRGVPLLLVLIFLYDVLPQSGIKIGAIATAMLGLGLNQAAYLSEIFRGSLAAVNPTQVLAARSLGMHPIVTFLRIVVPQALRAALPGMGNQAVNAVKETSLASVVGVDELTLRSEQLVSVNFQFIPVFTAAAALYLLTTSVIAAVTAVGERRLDRGSSRASRLVSGRVWRWFQGGRAPKEWIPELLENWLYSAAHSGQHAGIPTLRCTNLSKTYGNGSRPVLQHVSLEVFPGEVVVIMGPSGMGKSTLLRLLAGLEKPDEGSVWIQPGVQSQATETLRPVRPGDVAIVFQEYNLFEHLTILENVAEALLSVYGRLPAEARAYSRACLELVGLAAHADDWPHQLSGGQRQRAAIARALATQPRCILLDEPTSALDWNLAQEILTLVGTLAKRGIAVIVVTHDERVPEVLRARRYQLRDGQLREVLDTSRPWPDISREVWTGPEPETHRA